MFTCLLLTPECTQCACGCSCFQSFTAMHLSICIVTCAKSVISLQKLFFLSVCPSWMQFRTWRFPCGILLSSKTYSVALKLVFKFGFAKWCKSLIVYCLTLFWKAGLVHTDFHKVPSGCLRLGRTLLTVLLNTGVKKKASSSRFWTEI